METTAVSNWIGYWGRILVKAFQEAALNQPVFLAVLLVMTVAVAVIAGFGVEV